MQLNWKSSAISLKMKHTWVILLFFSCKSALCRATNSFTSNSRMVFSFSKSDIFRKKLKNTKWARERWKIANSECTRGGYGGLTEAQNTKKPLQNVRRCRRVKCGSIVYISQCFLTGIPLITNRNNLSYNYHAIIANNA